MYCSNHTLSLIKQLCMKPQITTSLNIFSCDFLGLKYQASNPIMHLQLELPMKQLTSWRRIRIRLQFQNTRLQHISKSLLTVLPLLMAQPTLSLSLIRQRLVCTGLLDLLEGKSHTGERCLTHSTCRLARCRNSAVAVFVSIIMKSSSDSKLWRAVMF